MKIKSMIISVLVLAIIVRMTFALDYNINPMNFPLDSSRELKVSVYSPGDIINVTYPSEFTLISGASDGIGTVLFKLASPNSSQNGDLYFFNVSINGTFIDNLIAMAVPDSEIVDNKWELGHGNFNYPECDYLPDDPALIFPIIRVWGVGTDILDEPATNITFTCHYPKIRPRTVDSKYTTDYSDSNYLEATAMLESWEGASMFRVFVLSQEVDYNVGQNYEVLCSNIVYQFNHHTVNASILPINITMVDPDPFVVITGDTDEFAIYTIQNNGSYEVRDLEFIWQTDNNQIYREELDVMYPGDVVLFRVWANGNPNIDFTIRQKPCWMFNSRDPLYYEHTQTDSFNINTNATSIFSIDEAIYYQGKDFADISDSIDKLLFLFKINQEEYHMTVSLLPDQQQNEANFTCYRLALRSNGFNMKPNIRMQTNATIPEEIIVKNQLFQTMEFGFTTDSDGFGVVSWETDLGVCTEDTITQNFVCPVTYNYICLAPGLFFQKEAEVPKSDCIICKDKVLEIGAKISPAYPAIGAFALLALLILGIYYYYYYEDELSLKTWIMNRRRKKEQEDYVKWRMQQQEQMGGRLF